MVYGTGKVGDPCHLRSSWFTVLRWVKPLVQARAGPAAREVGESGSVACDGELQVRPGVTASVEKQAERLSTGLRRLGCMDNIFL